MVYLNNQSSKINEYIVIVVKHIEETLKINIATAKQFI